MNRKTLITVHLYLAAFFTPILIMMAISGGAYLLGYKGTFETSEVYRGQVSEFNFDAEDKKAEIEGLIKKLEIDYSFEYVKGGGNTLYTRPFSKDHYVFQAKGEELVVSKREPDFLKSLVELHKGHGPLIFKDFQKVMALGLLIVLISGFLLGITSPMLKVKSYALSGAGLAVFVVLALV